MILEQYSQDLEKQFDYFNKLFFNGELSKIPVSFENYSRGDRGAAGMYHLSTPRRISLNADSFSSQSDKYIDSVLIHEMIHQWMDENNLDTKQHHSKTFKNKVDEINKISGNKYRVGYTEVSAAIDDEDLEIKKTYWVIPLYQSGLALKNLQSTFHIMSEETFSLNEVMKFLEWVNYKTNVHTKSIYILEVNINNNFITEESLKGKIDVIPKGYYTWATEYDRRLFKLLKQSKDYQIIGRYDWKTETFVKTNKENFIMDNAIQLKEGQRVLDENDNEYIIEKGDILQEAALYIDSKELRDAFPELYKYYLDILDNKKPKISIETTDEYSFNPSVSEHLSDYFVFKKYVFYRNGKVLEVFDANDGIKPKPSVFKLQPGDAVMICDYGYYKSCTLVVHPDFMNPEQLPGKSDLSNPEIYALLVINSIVSAYRKEYFSQPLMKIKYGGVSNYRNFKPSENEFKMDVKELAPSAKTYTEAFTDFIFPMLADKGLIKINAKGSVQITIDGKNQAEQYR